MFTLEIIDETQLSVADDREIRTLLCTCFPPDVVEFSRSRHWHGSAPEFTLIHRGAPGIDAQVGVVRRRVMAGGVPVVVGGIQSLAVLPAWRGSGLAQALMKDCMTEAKRRGIPFGLLFCVPALERFYAQLGWRCLDVDTTMRDESGETVSISGKNIVMTLDLTAAVFPPGDIDVQGRDW